MWCDYKGCCRQGTSFVIGCGCSGRNTGQEPDKQLWQFRLRPLVLHSFSCGCPPQLYLVTVESAVVAPAGDLLSIGKTSSKRRVPYYGGLLHPKRCCRKTPVADRYLTDRTQRRKAAGAQLNPPGWTLGTARCFSQRRQALYSLRLLRTGSAPRSLLIKRDSK